MGRDIGAQPRHRFREFIAAAGRFAKPERNGRRHAVRILDAHDATLDPLDAIAPVAELEDIAGDALDREILIYGADDMILGFEQNLAIGIVWDGSTRGERR